MLLKDVTFTAARPLKGMGSSIESMSRVVCSLMIRFLGNHIQTPNFWKVSIRLNHSDRADDGRVLQGVLLKYAEMDLKAFPTLSSEEKGMEILNLLVDSLEDVFAMHGLPMEALSEARAFVIEQGFRNTFAAKPGVRSPDKQRVAYVTAEQRLDAADIQVRNDAKDGELVRTIPIATDSPDEFIFQRYFGKISWIDDVRLTLTRVDGVEIPLSVKPD